LRKGFELSFNKLTESAILETFDHRAGALRRHEEHTFSWNETAGIVDFSEQCGLFNGRAQQSQRTYRGSTRRLRRRKDGVPDTKP
jgi:hypothetical protein